MNRPPEVFIRVDEEQLLNFSIACFEKVGITHEHAALINLPVKTPCFRLWVLSPLAYCVDT